MRLLTFPLALLATFLISACGGGGGSPGAVPGVTPVSPTLGLTLTDAVGNNLSNNAINGSATFFARALVRDRNNAPIPRQLVTFSTDAGLAVLTPTTALTDDSGVARVQIAPVAAGAASLMAVAQVGTAAIEGRIAFQTTPTRTTLSDLSAAQPTLNTLQSTDVSVQVRVNNIPAIASEVNVAFTASCGTFSPATAATATGGLARTTYTPTTNCSGPVTLTASAPNAIAVTSTVTIAASIPAALRFVGVSEPLIVVSSASSGATTSLVSFRVVDGGGLGIRGQNVTLNLDVRSIQSGVRFVVNGVSTSDPQTATSDADGLVLTVVRSGTVPTPVVVTATLAGNSAVRASSSGLAVTTGRAAQDRISLAASSLAIEAASGSGTTDGVTSTLTMRIADRLGNPVPNGTSINFVSSAGRVESANGTPGSGGVSGACVTSNSQCTVTFITQAQRPVNGLVTILGFLDGEEQFTDTNGDNAWNPGETFGDRGRIYLDLNANGIYEPSDQLIADTAPGISSCNGTTTTVANTCDGTWSGNTRVSTSVRVSWSSSQSVITFGTFADNNLPATVADNRGNSMPVASAIAVVGCAGATVSPTAVPNSIIPTNIIVNIPVPRPVPCLPRVTVTSPSGVLSGNTFTLPPVAP